MIYDSFTRAYFWIAYSVLEYLYEQTKNGEKVDYQELLEYDYRIETNLNFNKYVLQNLEKNKWIEISEIKTKTFDHLMHEQHVAVEKTDVSITHEGIVQLIDNKQFKELMFM